MHTSNNKLPDSLIWTVGIAIILFCGAGTAAFMGWIPSSLGRATDPAAVSTSDSSGKISGSAAPSGAALYALKEPAAALPQGMPLPPAASTPPATVAPTTTTAAPAVCRNCGVVTATREIAVKGEGNGVGAVGGAVVGGLLGHQIGNGNGRTLATIAGAVGGVVAGNEIEKRVNTTRAYEITVRMEDGSRRVFRQSTLPAWRNGEAVRIVNGSLHAA